MIISKPAFDRDEVINWHLTNTRTDVNFYIPNIHGIPCPHPFSAYNAPEYLHVLLANRHFETLKERQVMVYHVHGGRLYATVSFERSVHPGEWPDFYRAFDITKKAKSHKLSWWLNETPLEFLRGSHEVER